LCEPFSAHKAARLGIVSGLVPALKIGGTFVPNPTVTTDRMLDEYGRVIHGDFKTGAAYREGLGRDQGGEVDLSLLDAAVEELCAKLLETFPRVHDEEPRGAAKTEAERVEREQGELPRVARPQHDETRPRRVPRLQRGDEGDRPEIDFVKLRQGLARGIPWSEELIDGLVAELLSRRSAR